MPNDTLTLVEKCLETDFKIKDWEGVKLIFAVATAYYCQATLAKKRNK